MKPVWETLCAEAEVVLDRLLAELPETLREQAAMAPVAFEARPSLAMQRLGIEPDTLGLFTGPEWERTGDTPFPPQIILYLENIWDASATDGKRFDDELATTFWHELGHFLGFDEADMGPLGLE